MKYLSNLPLERGTVYFGSQFWRFTVQIRVDLIDWTSDDMVLVDRVLRQHSAPQAGGSAWNCLCWNDSLESHQDLSMEFHPNDPILYNCFLKASPLPQLDCIHSLSTINIRLCRNKPWTHESLGVQLTSKLISKLHHATIKNEYREVSGI